MASAFILSDDLKRLYMGGIVTQVHILEAHLTALIKLSAKLTLLHPNT